MQISLKSIKSLSGNARDFIKPTTDQNQYTKTFSACKYFFIETISRLKQPVFTVSTTAEPPTSTRVKAPRISFLNILNKGIGNLRNIFVS